MLSGIHGHQDIERVVYGKPAGVALRAEAERLGAKQVFITTSKSVAQSALLASVIDDLGDRYAGVYAGITAHSPRPCVVEGAEMARKAGADLIVAVGGGSVIDATKTILIALWQNVTDGRAARRLSRRPAPRRAPRRRRRPSSRRPMRSA